MIFIFQSLFLFVSMFYGLVVLPCSYALQARFQGDDGTIYCATFKTISVGAPATVEKCSVNDPNNDKWVLVHQKNSKNFRLLIEDTLLYAGLDENNQMVLNEKNENDPSQFWARKDSADDSRNGRQYTNQKTGESMCSEMVLSTGASDSKLVMKPCDSSNNHQFNLGIPNHLQ